MPHTKTLNERFRPIDFEKVKVEFHRLSQFELTKEGKIQVTGPFSPIHAAKTIAEAMDSSLMVLYRFNIPDVFKFRYYQEMEYGEGWTGHDTLIMFFNDRSVCLYGFDFPIQAWYLNTSDELEIIFDSSNHESKSFYNILNTEDAAKLVSLVLPQFKTYRSELREAYIKKQPFIL